MPSIPRKYRNAFDAFGEVCTFLISMNRSVVYQFLESEANAF